MIGAFLDSLRQARLRKSKDPAQADGRRGEDLAHRSLQRKGFAIVARNYRLPSGDGQADVIAWDGDTLVFVEQFEHFRDIRTSHPRYSEF